MVQVTSGNERGHYDRERQRKASHRGRHFDKVEASGDTDTKTVRSGCIDFRNKNIIDYLVTSIVLSLR